MCRLKARASAARSLASKPRTMSAKSRPGLKPVWVSNSAATLTIDPHSVLQVKSGKTRTLGRLCIASARRTSAPNSSCQIRAGETGIDDPCLPGFSHPVGRCVVVLVGLGLPIAVGPGVIAERRCVLELLLGNAGDITAQFVVVFEGGPRDWIVAVPKADEAPEAHHGIGDTP